MKFLSKILLGFFVGLLFIVAATILFPQESLAFNISKLGMHILHPEEVALAKRVVTPNVLGSSTDVLSGIETAEGWNYVTIPLTLEDIEDPEKWQLFFDVCRQQKMIPIVRLTTRYNSDIHAWEKPTKFDIVKQISFLSELNWPSDQLYIIAFNEVNHAKEWGGTVAPGEYTRILRFTASWAHTEQKKYVVLPAAMDLDAPNSSISREAFSYLNAMYAADKGVFQQIDVWNSHSYPNPGFASSPQRYGKNSLRGYQYELNWLELNTGRSIPVMITETGWEENPWIASWLGSYYTYAMQHIWSDDRVVAVTPFVLRGSPGPFAGFSFIDAVGRPTNQYFAVQQALHTFAEEK